VPAEAGAQLFLLSKEKEKQRMKKNSEGHVTHMRLKRHKTRACRSRSPASRSPAISPFKKRKREKKNEKKKWQKTRAWSSSRPAISARACTSATAWQAVFVRLRRYL
jgi:hypothetical protein